MCPCAVDAKQRILAIMAETISCPRPDYKTNSPVVSEVTVAPEQIARFLGSGGVNLRKLKSDIGVSVSGVGEGRFHVFAPNREAHDEAEERIQQLLQQDVSASEGGGVSQWAV